MYKEILDNIVYKYNKILSENLVGIYVHGSIAFDCFHWHKSDIDFLVVVKEPLVQQQKVALIKALLDLNAISPPKGLEMSVVLEKHCSNFVYPTPFELHFSNGHIQRCYENLVEYCKTMNGTDIDLAAHFMVTKRFGIVLCGKEIADIFADIPKEAYLDSIKSDIKNARDEVTSNPVYYILNLCRVLAYMEDDVVISKQQGGIWGVKNLPNENSSLIQGALDNYCFDKDSLIDLEAADSFSEHMISRIFAE